MSLIQVMKSFEGGRIDIRIAIANWSVHGIRSWGLLKLNSGYRGVTEIDTYSNDIACAILPMNWSELAFRAHPFAELIIRDLLAATYRDSHKSTRGVIDLLWKLFLQSSIGITVSLCMLETWSSIRSRIASATWASSTLKDIRWRYQRLRGCQGFIDLPSSKSNLISVDRSWDIQSFWSWEVVQRHINLQAGRISYASESEMKTRQRAHREDFR